MRDTYKIFKDKVAKPDVPDILGPEGIKVDYGHPACPALTEFTFFGPNITEAQRSDRPAKPALIKTGGQSGSGKSYVINKYREPLAKEAGGVIHFDWDELRKFKPDQWVLDAHTMDPEDLARYRARDITFPWCQQIINESFESGRNMILDGRLESASITRSSMEDFASRGYEIKLVIMAVNPLLCRMGDYLRMVETAAQLQRALREADALPQSQKEEARLRAFRANFPRVSTPDRHSEDVKLQLDSLDELDHLTEEGIVTSVDIWERNKQAPSITLKAREPFKKGQTVEFYRKIINNLSSDDYRTLLEQAQHIRSLLKAIDLPQIKKEKYASYVDELCNDALKFSCEHTLLYPSSPSL